MKADRGEPIRKRFTKEHFEVVKYLVIIVNNSIRSEAHRMHGIRFRAAVWNLKLFGNFGSIWDCFVVPD